LSRNEHDVALKVTVGRISAVITASGATVIVGLASMYAARFGMIQTTGPALAIAIFITLLAGLTLTPSLLAIFGRHLFWPLHERTRTAADDEKGFWAALARRITARPGLMAGLVLAALILPSLALPQLKQNFDVLNELPSGAESRQGFETLSRHLAAGQLMPLTVLIKVPAGGSTVFASEQGLVAMGTAERAIAALPNVQTVRSEVDPAGEGSTSDLLRPSLQLPKLIAAYEKPPSTDINVQLGDASIAGVKSTASYVGGLHAAFPNVATGDLNPVNADLATLSAGLTSARVEALVPNQLNAIAGALQAAAAAPASVGAATQLAALKSYLDELGVADPAVPSVSSYKSAESAVVALAASPGPAAFTQLLASLHSLSTWFGDQQTPFYFAPAGIAPSDGMQATQVAMAAVRTRLPAELERLAADFGPTDLYASPDLSASFVSSDGAVARIYVTTSTNPYDQKSFDTVRELRTLMATDPGDFAAVSGAGNAAPKAYVGGATAEFTDVQDTISADFLRVAAITILGILIVLILLLRALVAPIYLVLTVLLSYATSLSVSALILQNVFGQAGFNYFIPLMVFVLLVALGSDYNIFLMSRVREESSTRDLRPGIRIASARTGTVITSAGLILAGTFGALVTSPLQLLFQVGLAVALGVLIDTFIVRSLLVPAITAFIGERAWWPFHRSRVK
jgi:RND superfamily putative drug exporter